MQGWKDRDSAAEPVKLVDNHADLLEDDEDFEQAAEQFEAQYNFRFEVDMSNSMIVLVDWIGQWIKGLLDQVIE